MHVEAFFQPKPPKRCYKFIKHKFMLIPNKHKILPYIILQFAENWHKTIFDLGLQASITSLVQTSNLR